MGVTGGEESRTGGAGSDLGSAAVGEGSSAGVTEGKKSRTGGTGSVLGSAAGGTGVTRGEET